LKAERLAFFHESQAYL